MKLLVYLVALTLFFKFYNCSNVTSAKNFSINPNDHKRTKALPQMLCNTCYSGFECLNSRQTICPMDKHLCATRAYSPRYSSRLTCSAVIPGTCLMTFEAYKGLDILCTCRGSLCNRHFSARMETAIFKFGVYVARNPHFKEQKNLTDVFLFWAYRINTSFPHIYEIVTGQVHHLTKTKGVSTDAIANSNQAITDSSEAITDYPDSIYDLMDPIFDSTESIVASTDSASDRIASTISFVVTVTVMFFFTQ